MRRRLARELALQSLYQMQMNGVNGAEAVKMAVEEAVTENEAGLVQKKDKVSAEAVQELVEGVEKNQAVIDGILSEYLKGWQIDRLSRVDREVLRLAVYEMVYTNDTPPKVVVNEAIELAKHFGTDESGKFVNGVLGKMIGELEAVKHKMQG